MYDAIVVGARCAGAPTAMLLARNGHKVLLCDRASFPSDTVSNGAFNRPGPYYLRRWGLLDTLVSTGVPPVTSVTNHFGPQTQRIHTDPTYAPMRRILDELLVRAAVDAGAELREELRITGVVKDGERVCGIRAAHEDQEVVESARIVVGADGRRSTVARRIGAREHSHVPMDGGGVYAYFEDVAVDGYEFWVRPAWAMLAPSNDGLTHVATAGSTAGTPTERFQRVLDAYPDLAERVAAGRRRTRLVTYRDAPVFFRDAWGPGWALVGDAGFHQGPWNGYGMSHAFRDAERLADAIHEWLSGESTFEVALGGYGRDRDAWCQPFHDNILEVIEALQKGRPQDAPFGGERPHVERWLEQLRAEQATV